MADRNRLSVCLSVCMSVCLLLWCGAVRYDAVRCGVVWCGVVWCASITLMIPSMDMDTTSDEKALTLAATSEHTWPTSRQMTCGSNAR